MTITEFANFIIPIYILLFGVIISYVAFKKHKNKGKIPCIILKRNKKLSVEYRKTEGSTILTDWKQNPIYKPGDFYEEEKPSWKFWRLAKRFLVIPEHAEKALSGKFSTFKAGWTEAEDKKYIAKMVAKARQRGQLISNTWAIIIIAMLSILIILSFYGWNKIGVL